MNERSIGRILLAAVVASLALVPEPTAAQGGAGGAIDWKAVDAAMGRPGTMMSGDVYRFNMPRGDLTVVANGVRVAPALSLGSWIAFKATGPNEAVAMGDLVLTEGEYNGVIARLEQGAVGLTAVHKHLPAHSPALWWTHVHARGDPVSIAKTVRAALGLTGTPAASPTPAPAASFPLDTAGIHAALGHAGRVNGGVYQMSFPRLETIRAMGIDVPPAMGTATALNFQPTGDGKAAVNGDFVMLASEVDAVVQALRESGIDVVELHNHMTDEEPRLFFLHFWADDDALKLARGLRAALDRTNTARQ